MKKWWGGALAVSTVLVVYVCYCLLRPLPIGKISLAINLPTTSDLTATQLGVQRGAIGFINPSDNTIQCRALGSGEAYDTPRATASLAKMITVQVVLDAKPLTETEAGPLITMSADDEASYWWHVNNNGSNARVVAGEQISERQLIEGILLASANNMADTLAIWAFGSLENYHAAANRWLQSNGLTDTTVTGDASGLNPVTKSTPVDICKIMLLATRQPALVNILGEATATLPTGDIIMNTNRLLGQNGIFAGKTGYNDEANRGVMLASRQTINDTEIIVAAVSLSNDNYTAAFDGAYQILAAVPNDIKITKLNSQRLGRIYTTWGSQSTVNATSDIAVAHWSDQIPTINTNYRHLEAEQLSTGSVVGHLTVNDDDNNLIATDNITPASAWWRLTHPF
ncbi:MAG: hypothetical protein Q4C83_00195 [Candidatus Saccharibacteria bacterium]|nr:hypothetical protein [Candidatus Saccharibacteria bacterium]